jgi:serine/threonine protein kinase
VQSNGARIMPDSPTWTDTAHAWESGELERPTHGKLVKERRFGRHGDISPGNILWYDNDDQSRSTLRGTLKLSDFGEAELNSRFSRTRKEDVAATMTYRAPECDFPPKHIRQSYDMWSLGCVFLEFVTWMLGGGDALSAFASQRLSRDPFFPYEDNDIFFEAEKDPESSEIKPKVKETVIQVSVVINLA